MKKCLGLVDVLKTSFLRIGRQNKDTKKFVWKQNFNKTLTFVHLVGFGR